MPLSQLKTLLSAQKLRNWGCSLGSGKHIFSETRTWVRIQILPCNACPLTTYCVLALLLSWHSEPAAVLSLARPHLQFLH